MNFLQGMNQAIRYIEGHLEEKVNLQEAAAFTGYSSAYFQRIFAIVAEISVTEYIRNRRMTLAAIELQNSNIRILDLAIRYGYESSDSFSRAFQTVHGVNPSVARKEEIALKSFPPMSFHISIKGDGEMNYRIKSTDKMRVVGVMHHFHAPENKPEDVNDIWNQYFKNGVYDKFLKISNGEPTGVHGFMQVIDEENVDYMIGVFTDKEVPVGMEEHFVPESKWAIFELQGPVNREMETAWKRIFDEWLPSVNYKHAQTMEIECFPYEGRRDDPNFKFEIWVPIV